MAEPKTQNCSCVFFLYGFLFLLTLLKFQSLLTLTSHNSGTFSESPGRQLSNGIPVDPGYLFASFKKWGKLFFLEYGKRLKIFSKMTKLKGKT